MLGDGKLNESATLSFVQGEPPRVVKSTGGWLGITTTSIGPRPRSRQTANLQGRFASSKSENVDTYQTDYLLDATTVAAGGKTTGAVATVRRRKEAPVVDGYEKLHGIRISS